MTISTAASDQTEAWALLIFVFLFVPRNLHAQAPYRNPAVGDPNHVDPELAYPFVLKWNGEYFLYASGSPIIAYHSPDLAHWFTIPEAHSSATIEFAAKVPVAPGDYAAADDFYLYKE
jgi:hypothetical protein